MTRRQFLILIVPLLLVLLGYFGVVLMEKSGVAGNPPWDESFARDIRNAMAKEFAYGLGDRQHQLEAYFRALNGWISAYDDYGEVVPPWELDEVRERSSGQYYGIGVRTARPSSEGPVTAIRVSGVKPTGPAAKAGVQVGDEITAVNGRTIEQLCPGGDIKPLADAIRGERGTAVKLRLRSSEGAEREVPVTRDAIDTGSVFGARIVDEAAGVGYVRLTGFHVDTARSTRAAVKRLMEQGMKYLILDLRDNPGGLLDQAVEVADLFLESGVIVRVVGRGPEYPKVHEATAKGTLSVDLPLAVLLNRHSASASEILAGALQDQRRALVVGERSYGKFLVQAVEELPMEYGTVLFRRTTAIYETPAGHHYQRRRSAGANDPLAGIVPDVFVPTSEKDEGRLAEIFENEEYADWNPAQAAVHSEFVDPCIGAAIALLAGRPCYPPIAAADAAR